MTSYAKVGVSESSRLRPIVAYTPQMVQVTVVVTTEYE